MRAVQVGANDLAMVMNEAKNYSAVNTAVINGTDFSFIEAGDTKTQRQS